MTTISRNSLPQRPVSAPEPAARAASSTSVGAAGSTEAPASTPATGQPVSAAPTMYTDAKSDGTQPQGRSKQQGKDKFKAGLSASKASMEGARAQGSRSAGEKSDVNGTGAADAPRDSGDMGGGAKWYGNYPPQEIPSQAKELAQAVQNASPEQLDKLAAFIAKGFRENGGAATTDLAAAHMAMMQHLSDDDRRAFMGALQKHGVGVFDASQSYDYYAVAMSE